MPSDVPFKKSAKVTGRHQNGIHHKLLKHSHFLNRILVSTALPLSSNFNKCDDSTMGIARLCMSVSSAILAYCKCILLKFHFICLHYGFMAILHAVLSFYVYLEKTKETHLCWAQAYLNTIQFCVSCGSRTNVKCLAKLLTHDMIHPLIWIECMCVG